MKKIIAFILIAVMCLSFTACGDDTIDEMSTRDSIDSTSGNNNTRSYNDNNDNNNIDDSTNGNGW